MDLPRTDPRLARTVASDDLIEPVRATGLLPSGAAVVVLLSGGRDSVCLLDVAVRLAGAKAVTALHVNYGLRAASDEDEAHCRALCEGLGVALDVHGVRRPDDAGNLQAWARDVRLAGGARLAVARGARLATGHTASDQAETILYRLAASPGRRALLGMAARDGLLVRPLLGVTRQQTAAHCSARGLAWCEDASNADPAYARNRARAGLVPALRELHPAAEANLLATVEILRAEAEVLDGLVAEFIAGRTAIPRAELAALPAPLRRLVLIELAGAPVGHRVDEVLALEHGEVHIGCGRRATVRRGLIEVASLP